MGELVIFHKTYVKWRAMVSLCNSLLHANGSVYFRKEQFKNTLTNREIEGWLACPTLYTYIMLKIFVWSKAGA